MTDLTRRSASPLVATLLLLAPAAACGPTDEAAEARARGTGYRGIALTEPVPVPDFTLTRTDGRPYRFHEETDDKLALLFFGYTHCPDVCPVHMANIAAVLEKLPGEVRRGVEVVFVTTDPERDTLPRLREWLDRWDPAFVGLRGPLEEVNRIQGQLRLPAAVHAAADSADDDGGYAVGHASQVLAVGADDSVRVVYPFGTRQRDWMHDLPRLLREHGGVARADRDAPASDDGRTGDGARGTSQGS